MRFVTITFDDGLIEGARKAVDILAERNLPATFYLVTGWIRPREMPLTRDRWNRGKDHGSWNDWRAIQGTGHEIGSHTVTHLNAGGRIARWFPALLRWELAHSHAQIEQHLGVRPASIAMPWNAPARTHEALLRTLYPACRLGGQAPQTNDLTEVRWHSLRSWAPDSSITAGSIIEQIRATPPGHWLILQFHSFDGEGYMPVTSQKFREITRGIADLDNLEHVTVSEMARHFQAEVTTGERFGRPPRTWRKRRICLVTSEHLSMNPRLVKEADALHAAGFEVHTVSCQWMDWQRQEDERLLEKRGWRNHVVDFSRRQAPGFFWSSRLRHYAARQIAPLLSRREIDERAVGRVVPEMTELAASIPADLYIGHNLAGLPAAVLAAQANGVPAGFDAEDFHSSMWLTRTGPGAADRLAEKIEATFLRHCSYLTAAAPLIADAYSRKYKLPLPATVLNVFPFADRPPTFRQQDPTAPLTLYWFSQVIGARRGLEEIVCAIGSCGSSNISLHLRGQWQPDFETRLRDLAKLCGLREEQIVSHGLASPDDMIRLSAEYDVGLALEQPISENRDICVTNKICTYLLAGNAVIASATRGQQLLMDQLPDCGLCYKPGEVETVARQLKEWERDRAQLEHLRRNAWRYGEQRYNWEIEKQKLLTAVEQALAGPVVAV
jgi:peptidoglycan/xylan/chitin deacetylase (PgdA/CDA1 family)/glycosyltransferase involved in cell wall biosynthesis